MDIANLGRMIHEYQSFAQQPHIQILDVARELVNLGLQAAGAQALFQIGLILPPSQPPPLPPDQPQPIIFQYEQPIKTPFSSDEPRPLNQQDIATGNKALHRGTNSENLGASGDDDVFEHRIVNSTRQQKIIEALRRTYKKPIGTLGSTGQWNEFEISVHKVLKETAVAISDQDQLTSIVRAAVIISPTASFGEAIGQFYIDRFKKIFKANGNEYGKLFFSRFEQVLYYLQRTSKAQAVEIARNTYIPEEEVLTLLMVGPFTHHRTCYWRFADELQLERSDGTIIIRRSAKSTTSPQEKQKESPNHNHDFKEGVKGTRERFYDFNEKYGSYPLIQATSVTEQIWREWQPKVLELLKTDLDSGWELDRNAMGPSCLIYEKKRVNPIFVETGATLVYLFIALITYGFGLLAYPFFTKDFIVLKGIRVRYVKKRKIKSKQKGNFFSRLFNRNTR